MFLMLVENFQQFNGFQKFLLPNWEGTKASTDGYKKKVRKINSFNSK